jgi:nitrate/nitrite transport system permease protein
MTNATDTINGGEAAARLERKAALFQRINKASRWLDALGLSWLTPLLKIAAGDNLSEQLGELKRVLVIPLIGIAIFLVGWGVLAPQVQTSLGAVPGAGAGLGAGGQPLGRPSRGAREGSCLLREAG